MDSSESSESGYRSQSSVDSLEEEHHFVIKKGYLLIINNVRFRGMFFPRNGTKAEGENMQEFFKSFGFDVDIEYQCTAEGIRNLLTEKTSSHLLGMYHCLLIFAD